MTNSKSKLRGGRKRAAASQETGRRSVIYIHGIGAQPAPDVLKRDWDLALFGKEMGGQTRMAYWADILHGDKPSSRTRAIRSDTGIDIDALLREAGVPADSDGARLLSMALASRLGVTVPEATGIRAAGMQKRILPLPAAWRKPLARAFLEHFIQDVAAYFFRPDLRKEIRQRLIDILPVSSDPVTVVAHSQGTVVALEVLAALAENSPVRVGCLVTIGSPLGIQEVQDFLSCPVKVPGEVAAWYNFADRFDPVALDKGLGDDFEPGGFIVDRLVSNLQARQLEGFNPHAAAGYLALPEVRQVVYRATQYDMRAPFLMARDVAAGLAVDARQSVLIEILEPGNAALDESREEMQTREVKRESRHPSLATRIERAAAEIEKIVERTSGQEQVKAARVDRLRRFVTAALTPAELNEVARCYRDLHVYSVWKSNVKRKLLNRSVRVIQAEAAEASYGASGTGVTWAVLDTGVRRDHPHFKKHGNIVEVWDCTKRGRPQPLPDERDSDGHGTHVSGIIAGAAPDGSLHGIASRAKLVVYKVLDDSGDGEDACIIKALDHIVEQNEHNSAMQIHGVNLSLGGPYDSTVYGCGFTPICMELRRLWRSGVLVVVASGNEGQVQVNTPNGDVEFNSPMAIGDPANLEDCIAVGSVNADSPHLHGVSAFSSRGPTSDGRLKPDVVAPGERIRSCNSRYSSSKDLYREESGTSMAAPHISGLLAAFLSVRPEYRGRPDEVKEILLRTCTDIRRDRYIQGHGIPNLMKMLLET